MIYTVTLNPALDRTIWVERIKEDVSNRIVKEMRYAGGKGIDVSRVLKNLGMDNVSMGFVGGFSGRELEGRLLNDGIESDFVHVSGDTRTNIVIHETETRKQIAFNALGPEVKPHELMQLVDKIEALKDPDLVTIGGSLPVGLSPEVYRKLIRTAKNRGARVGLDVDRDALKVGIQARPSFIKPNIHELGQLVGREIYEITDVAKAARDIQKSGVEMVLVSMGPRGILVVAEGEGWLAVPPQVKVENTIGAGDSSVAGFVYGIMAGMELSEALRSAAAAGTATTLNQGTALCRREDFISLLPRVEVRPLEDVK